MAQISIEDGWTWVTGTGNNRAGESFQCTAFRHSGSALVVEVRLDSAHGALFRNPGGDVMRVDRHDGSVMKREAFLAPDLEKSLGESGGAPVDSKPAALGEWKQGLNASTKVLTLSFVYKDNSKIQAYLTRKGEFLWYPLMGQTMYADGSGHSVKTRSEANACLR